MHRIINQLKRFYSLFLLLIGCLFFSCVYFNTFYNAETSYKQALNIIEESPIMDEIEVPEQAKKLLAEAMENSKVVLQKYPESKYVDDAIYIIAKASFLRNEVAIAESYFNQLLRDYPQSKFYSLSEIWLTYTHLRMGMMDKARNEIESIQANSPKGGEELYLIHNILAEIAMEEGNIDNIYFHYEKAAEYAPSKSKKISIYGKLVLYAEKEDNKSKASEYLVSLGDVAPEKIRIDARMKWITYQRELGNYDEIISEIHRMLGMSEFTSEYMQLELELGKVYKGSGEFELAKEIFGMLVEKYSKKDETAEAYYQLGFMSLMEDFNLDLAREYFEKSRTEKSSSFYARESKELLNKITRYETLQNHYKEANNNSDEGKEDTNGSEMEEAQGKQGDESGDMNIGTRLGGMGFGPNIEDKTSSTMEIRPDSILFIIGEMLLYDFNHLDRSLEKMQTLILEYPESKFASQSLYVLSYFEPDEGWYEKLKTVYPNSAFLNPNSEITDTSLKAQLEIKRDYAWSLSAKSFEDSYAEFDRLHTQYQDTLSAYIRAYISDYYLNDIGKTIKHYTTFADRFPDHRYFAQVDNRLKIIESDLEMQKAISQQGIDYQHAVQLFQKEKDFDSTEVLLDDIAQGESSLYKEAANQLKAVMRDYQKLIDEINDLTPSGKEDSVNTMITMSSNDIESGKDSLIYLLAELFAHDLKFEDSALYYHQELVSSYTNSKYRPYSIMALKDLEPNGRWENILVTDYPDTSFTPDSTIHQTAYHSIIFEDNFTSDQARLVELCETYLEFFPELIDSSLFPPDTTIVIDDSLFIPLDSMSIPIDSLMMPKDTTSTYIPPYKERIAP